MNINKSLKSVLFICRKSGRQIFFINCMQQACNDGISRISSVKVHFLQYSSYLFLKVFSCQISLNSNEWFSRNRRISEKAIPHSIAILLNYHTCAAFNWVLSIRKQNLRIADFFASLPFLT